MKHIRFGLGLKGLLSLCFFHSFSLLADAELSPQKKSPERVDWQAFSDGLDWNKYAEIMLQKQDSIFERHSKEIDDYMLAIENNNLIRSVWLENREKVYQSFAIAEHKKYNDEGMQLRAVVLDHVVEGFAERMQGVSTSAKEKIVCIEEELRSVIKQHDEFLMQRNELEQVYNIILRHPVERSEDLKKGIESMEKNFLEAIAVRKSFLDSLSQLVDETEETIETMKKETLLQSSVITASNGQVIKKS